MAVIKEEKDNKAGRWLSRQFLRFATVLILTPAFAPTLKAATGDVKSSRGEIELSMEDDETLGKPWRTEAYYAQIEAEKEIAKQRIKDAHDLAPKMVEAVQAEQDAMMPLVYQQRDDALELAAENKKTNIENAAALRDEQQKVVNAQAKAVRAQLYVGSTLNLAPGVIQGAQQDFNLNAWQWLGLGAQTAVTAANISLVEKQLKFQEEQPGKIYELNVRNYEAIYKATVTQWEQYISTTEGQYTARKAYWTGTYVAEQERFWNQYVANQTAAWDTWYKQVWEQQGRPDNNNTEREQEWEHKNAGGGPRSAVPLQTVTAG